MQLWGHLFPHFPFSPFPLTFVEQYNWCILGLNRSVFATQCYASAAYVVMRCLCVCLCVRHVREFLKTNKYIIINFSPSGSHTILVFPCQTA